MKIENWAIVGSPFGPFKPYSSEYEISISGTVYGNPKFEDGKWITTSKIVGYDFDANCVITKSNSLYELGTVNPDYEKEYPDAYNRLLNQFKK